MSVALEHRRKDGNAIGSGLVHREQGKDVSIWSKEYNIINEMTAPPPPIPARSRLRTVSSDAKPLEDHSESVATQFEVPSPVSGTSTDMKIITHRQSSLSLFKLPVDPLPPPPMTPASPTFSSSIKESPSNDSTFGFGKRKSSKAVERDPLKVRDGLQAKESTSGVYTPLTFPGAQGPRPSHFPTHVYTPTNFSLYPQGDSPASPSGSSSSSQSDSTAPPKTPLSPTGRLSKAVSSNMRRLSSGIVSLKDRTYYANSSGTMHQRSVTTPMLESGEYNYQGSLSNACNSYETNLGGTGTGHSRESSSSWASWGDMIGNSKPRIPSTLYHTDTSYFPPVSSPISQNVGLGMGIEEGEGTRKTGAIDSSSDPVNFADGPGPRDLGPGSGSLAGKGKRKPVPRLGGGEEPQVHAM
ncbi:hypothetical protein L486_00037 [Kwoniella mangroviensis CBS 10435]|uniref:Uncharacterized protein n=1 Tax=Kwoniella mangroviensis CBS 10435 TaxID=1331196 RepID=A0A1B9IY94_9TREE|nr:hypothetical protein L486_00037 [Kwoniella mangroviensis CBS 10435]